MSPTAAYTCGNCRRDLPAGARWCPHCHSTAITFVGPETAESVVEVVRPVIVDDNAIWKTPEGQGSVDRLAPQPERAARYRGSRWRSGVNTFGPVGRIVITLMLVFPIVAVWFVASTLFGVTYGTCFTLGVGGIWLASVRLILPDTWRKERTFSTPIPYRRSLRELRDVTKRRRDERAAHAFGRFRCASCGAARRRGERVCYRCDTAEWLDSEGPGGYFACGRCDTPDSDVAPRECCDKCYAPRSEAIYIQPS